MSDVRETPIPLADRYLELLLAGDRNSAGKLVLEAVAAGMEPRRIYLEVFQPALYEIGRRWERNELSVAQEHFCTAATQLIMARLYPQIFDGSRGGKRLVVACVSGDLHEIGARMVADFFEMDGWDTYFTGASTPTDDVVRLVADRRADVLAVSATITIDLDPVRAMIESVRRHPGNEAVKVIVGGHRFNREPGLWREVGADGTAPDAQQAIELAGRIA